MHKARITSYNVCYTKLLRCRGQKQLFTTLLTSFAGAFIPISLVMGLALRSRYYAILAIIPNVLPVFFILALMGWLSIPLSVATVTVASIVRITSYNVCYTKLLRLVSFPVPSFQEAKP